MKRKRSQKMIADINIAPFTDVMLVLLIIFMVTTPFIYRSSIKVQLPQVSTKDDTPPPKDINVTINSAGEAFLDNKRYNLKLDGDLLRFQLARLNKETRGESAIVINGDRNVKYDYVVQVIDAATSAGIKGLVLSTEFKR